jgi:signal transduction histidine kinase
LSAQFLLLSSPILLATTLLIGWWIGHQVKDSVVHRIGGVTALYVDSFVAPHAQTLTTAKTLSASDREALDADFANTPLGRKIISLKLWRKDGHVLFSNDPEAMGRTFAVGPGLAQALAGNIFSEISERSDLEKAGHGQPLSRLIETYTPIRALHTGEVIAAAEFYEDPEEVDREAGAAQRRSWLVVAGAMLTMYLLLFVVVRRGSRTITEQQRNLGTTVRQLSELNEQNTRLQQRVIGAAERATASNENLLQRISADIHDGPGQDLGFALMQLKNLGEASAVVGDPQAEWAKSLEPARLAVQSALADLRTISADLELPDIAKLSLPDIAARVVRDFQIKTGASVALCASIQDVRSSFRVRVTLYRVLQESLANALRHAQCKQCRVDLTVDRESVTVSISDRGPGFDEHAALAKGRLGLHGMRHRVEVLGGSFGLHSTPDLGTTVQVTLPLTSKGDDDG